MNLLKHSRLKLGVMLGLGAGIALVLCTQCVRTYLYTDSVLVPQQAEREAERQAGALGTAARSAGIMEPQALGPVIEHALESAGDRVSWMRVLDMDGHVFASGGKPEGIVRIPQRWWERIERHETPGVLADTAAGRALVAILPFRMPRPVHPPEKGPPAGAHRGPGYVVELAIPLTAVSGAYEGLRSNLIVGVIASAALLLAVAVIGFRIPNYLRGRYLQSEMQLARRVQSDLQPKSRSISPHVEFGAAAVAADDVGGDFYDIFEMESGKIAIVLGDASGKGVPAALLVSVLQGAIRSSTASQHARACERINRMLCERTACERFATLFWGIFDPATNALRYVNAGHAAPILLSRGRSTIQRLEEGGPVLGLLPKTSYSTGSVQIEASDVLVLYSDGIDEATNENDEQFGEDRIQDLISNAGDMGPAEMCERIMQRVTAFASGTVPADDRTLMVVRFPTEGELQRKWHAEEIAIEAVA